MKGKLYVVGTPIGNLSDITFRAVEILKSVAFILCEDTRETAKLTSHYGIKTTLVSYRDQNHDRMIGKILEKLDMGLDIALVSDAGTPTISDPGFKLVRELRKQSYDVFAIPGADAVTSALSISGLPTDKYLFLGFLPKSESKREEMLVMYSKLDTTLCIYESPNRLVKLLKQIQKCIGNREVCIANDLTKKFELVVTEKIEELLKLEYLQNPKGEFVVLVGKE